MLTLKNPQEIALIKAGGKKLAVILEQLIKAAQPGVKTIELDQRAEKLIRAAGGLPAFKHYRDRSDDPPFPSTICASVNEQLVHTPASAYALKTGDIFTIDIGMKYPARGRGYYTDMAKTIGIGKISPQAKKLLQVTEQSLVLAIQQVKPGNYISDIGRAVQSYVEAQGFSVVRGLVGHGVGYKVHEEPRVPNFFDPHQPKIELQAGLVIAIEPMVNVGRYEISTLDDGWTVVTADGSLSAHFEHTVAVTREVSEILTQ